MKRIVWGFLGCLILLPSTRAASFDCAKATTKMEKLICSDAQLSQSDEELARAYSKAMKASADPAGIKMQQREWLSGVRKRCDDIPCFNAAYSARILQLPSTRNSVIQNPNPSSFVIVKTLQNKDLSAPYVETTPPEAGRRINAQLSGRPALTTFNEAQEAFSKQTKEDSGLISESYSVVRNDGQLLVLQFETEGCGAYCSTSSEQKIFDARTGHLVHPEELFTDQGAAILAQRLKENRIHRARAILAEQNGGEEEAQDMYARCIAEWSRRSPSLWPLNIDPDGRWRFVSGSCSNHAMRPFDTLDNLDQFAAIPELKPHLSPYGMSLLLGEGDVLDSSPTPVACKGGKRLPVRDAMRSAEPEIIASAGEDHHLLLLNNGQLWAWGRNDYGQLGNDGHMGETPVSVLVGSDFLQAAAGQFFSAAIRRDGTLWTWGMNYMGCLGNGDEESQRHPVRIGENFVALALDSYSGMALQRNGTLWTWGGEHLGRKENRNAQNQLISYNEVYRLTPRQLMTDVVQMEYGPRGERLALKKDGSIWAVGGFSAEAQQHNNDPWRPWLIGNGFSRLAARNGDLAFKADGSLWAWGETLSMMHDAQGRLDQGPTEVGRDYVNVKIDQNIVAALKADGSLWAPRLRGETIRMEQVGCGYADVVAGNGQILALKQDGSLLSWGNRKSAEDWFPNKHMFSGKPLVLGKDYSKLFQIGGLFGSIGAHALALKLDGTVWQWNDDPEPGERTVQNLMKKIPFRGDGKIPQ